MLRFLKKEEIIATRSIFPIKLKKEEEQQEKICDISVLFDQVDSSTQALIIGKQAQAGMDIQKKVDLTTFLLRNVITKIVVEDEIFERTSDIEERTLRYFSECLDISHNPSVAVFFGITQLVLDNIILPQETKKKSGQLDLPIEKESGAENAPGAKEDGQATNAKAPSQ